MGGPLGDVLRVIVIILAGTVGFVFAVYLVFKLFGLTFKFIGNIFRFIGAEVTDAVRLVGTVIAAPIFALLVVLNVLIGRWSASGHFGRAFGTECRSFAGCLYRLAISNPLKLFGLGGVLEGIEHRVPQAMAEAPGRDTPSKKRVGMFDGYTIIGSLPGGGSGGKLYIAEPDEIKRAALSRRGSGDVDRVVIKVFSQRDGSTLDQILRESRALEAARRLGLVLEHESAEDRFFYVMRYVPGESLGAVTTRLHAKSPPGGLTDQCLGDVFGYAADLLASLQTYHEGGLWHKDVKPENIIVDDPGTVNARAHLVDLGLVTPMRSAMTLTTHGTEYFRDPELVRQALRGVKVHQIDGAKFDVYSAGAVLFSVIENSFPAHGGLSQITKRCPEALRWVIRRAMAEYDRRYPSAAAMLGDLEYIRRSSDPFKIKPAELPSMSGGEVPPLPAPPPDPVHVVQAATPVPPPAPAAGAPGRGERVSPKLTVEDWWTGRYKPSEHGEMSGFVAKADIGRGAPKPARPAPAVRPAGDRAPAKEQLKRARERARVRRESAQSRIAQRRVGNAGDIRGNRAQRRIDHRRGAHARTESRSRWGMAGALLFALIIGGALVGVLVGKLYNDDWSSPTSVYSEHFLDGGELDGGWEGVFDDHDHDGVYTDARVLVLSDLPTPLGGDSAKSVHETLAYLESRGAHLVGDLVHEQAPINLVAKARAKRGATPLESDVLQAKLKPMLMSSDEFDAVVWVELNRGREGGHRYVLAAEHAHASMQGTDAEAGERLLAVLHKLRPGD